MKKFKMLSLPKRILSIVLSAILLAGIIYIPKATTSDALAGLPDKYDNLDLKNVGTLTSDHFGRCSGINPLQTGTDLNRLPVVTEGTPLHTAGPDLPDKKIVQQINLYFDKRTPSEREHNSELQRPAIYCLEPSAEFLPITTDNKYDSNIWVDGPLGQEGNPHTSASNLANIDVEQTRLLSYALAWGQTDLPGAPDYPLDLDNTKAEVNSWKSENDQYVRAAATQLIVWAIAQQWYRDPGLMGISPTSDPLQMLGTPDYDIDLMDMLVNNIPSNATGLYKFLTYYPNVQKAMESIWKKIWEEMDADKGALLDESKVSHNRNDKEKYTYTMRWDPDLQKYVVEIDVGSNLSKYEYRVKSTDPGNIVSVDFTQNTIIVTSDRAKKSENGVIIELEQTKSANTERQRAVVGYIVSKRFFTDGKPDSRDQVLCVNMGIYKPGEFNDNRAYFKVVWPPEVSALIQKKIDPQDTRPGISAAGFQFSIWRYANGIKGEFPLLGSPFITNSDGQIVLYETEAENLTPGTYWIEEIEQTDPTKPGYTGPYQLIKTSFTVLNSPHDPDSNPPVNCFDFENKLRVEFKKTIGDVEGEKGAGFKFNVWQYNEEGDYSGAPLLTFETGSDGKYKPEANKLLPGKYWIEEIEQTDPTKPGYTGHYDLIKQEFTVTDNPDVLHIITLKNKLLEIKFEKKLDERSTDSRDGFEFDIYKINATGDGPDLTKKVAYVVTDSEGIAKVNRADPTNDSPSLKREDDLNGETLPKGTYWITERSNDKSKKYYLINTDFTIENKLENYFALKNELIESEIIIDKNVDRGEDKQGFEFDIYEMNAAGDGPDLTKKVAYIVTDSEGRAKVSRADPTNDDPNLPREYDLDDKILPKSKYWIIERLTEKSKYYYLIDEEIVISTETGGAHNDGAIQYIVLENESRKVVVDKTMEDDPNRDISGIKFRIFPVKFKDAYKAGTITWPAITAERNADPDNRYFAEEFEIDAKGNYTLNAIPEGTYWIEEQPHEKNRGYWLIDEALTICESGFYIDGGEIIKFKEDTDNKLDEMIKINPDEKRYIFKPLLNKLIPEDKKVTIQKSLQNSSGAAVTPSPAAVYVIRLTPIGLPENRRTYTVTLNQANGWKSEINMAAGEYIIEEISGGEGYTVTYSPVVTGTSNRVSITGSNVNFTITVTNREGPPPPTTTNPPPSTTTPVPTTTPEQGTTPGPTTTQPTIEATTRPTQPPTQPAVPDTTIGTEPTPGPTTPEQPTEPTGGGEPPSEEDEPEEPSVPLGLLTTSEEDTTTTETEEEEVEEPPPPIGNFTTPTDKPNPETRDRNNLPAMTGLFILSVIGLVVVVFEKKRLGID